MNLDDLVVAPSRNTQRQCRVEQLLDEAQREKVRLARLAGHSFETIAAAIREQTGEWIGKTAVREWLMRVEP